MDPAERIARLEAELAEQWWENHAEHCGWEWPHPPERKCGWPPPALLDPKWLRGENGLDPLGLRDNLKDVD